jgi:hypothetical protein
MKITGCASFVVCLAGLFLIAVLIVVLSPVVESAVKTTAAVLNF